MYLEEPSRLGSFHFRCRAMNSTGMTLEPANIDNAATILANRRRAGQTGPRLPDNCRPTTPEDALAIQTAVTRRLGEAVGGWKCGTPSDDKLVVAPIYASTIVSGSPCAVWATAEEVRVEPELAFVLQADLPARDLPYGTDEIDAAMAGAHLALELIASRYDSDADITFNEKLADGLVNQGLFLGPTISLDDARQATEIPLRLVTASAEARSLAGVHPNRNPMAPLYWLVNFLRERGESLHAGQVVITGSYAGTFPLPIGQTIVCSYGTLGQLGVSFRAR